MCIGQPYCTELTDRTAWSRQAPLPPPEWTREHIDWFSEAVAHAASGRVRESRALLAMIPNDPIWEWCSKHGKMSGKHRYEALGRLPGPAIREGAGPRRPDFLAAEVFSRACYRCRYCELPVVPVSVLRAFSQVVGPAYFSFGGSDRERSGIGLLLWAQLDHVVPYSRGGATSVEDVVTSCWSCNYGKDKYTIEQIGLENPMARPPLRSQWPGLTEDLVMLEKAAASAAT